jgi:hypothetical protein
LYDYKTTPNPPAYSVLIAPSANIHLDWRISKSFSIQSMIGYRGKGDRIDVAEWISSIEQSYVGGDFITPYQEADGFIQTYVGYGELSLFPVINLGKQWQLGAGGYVAAGLHGEEKSDFEVSTFLEGNLIDKETAKRTRTIEFSDLVSVADDQTTRYFNRLDYGLMGYLGVKISPLMLGFTVHYGFEPWEPDSDLFGSAQNPRETYHLTGSVFLSYYFGKGRK